MRKNLMAVLILIISISIVGCSGKSTDVFKFDYTVKEEYKDKISEGLLEAFIEFTKDTKELYDTTFNEFKEHSQNEITEHDPMKALDILEIDNYMYDTVTMYEDFGGWNGQEEHILNFMSEQREVISKLGLLKLQYANYTIAIDNGKKPEQDFKYFNEELGELKLKTEENLKNAKIFID